eukprot:TRINITY_DN12770_c0_g1_i2.p1 TRINITY_DN12770_c0_g1~~TRINITY_DN12770_c0_g1_i2.p1  ORF type:complete len:716 (+),score=139.89 TRINITY_DN12770_c0_g1_i2:156-2303(+)
MVTSMPSFYDVLCVDHTVTAEELRVAFKRRALAVHPDKGGVKEEFVRVVVAFETLSDPLLRKRYDRKVTASSLPSNPASASAKMQPPQPPPPPADMAPSVERPSRSAGVTGDPWTAKATRKRRREANVRSAAHASMPTMPAAKARASAAGTTPNVPATNKTPATATISQSKNERPKPPPAASPTPPETGVPQARARPGLDKSRGEGFIVSRIVHELRRLIPTDRRRVIKETLSAGERMKLEEFMTCSAGLSGSTGGCRDSVGSSNIAATSQLAAADCESDDSYENVIENSDKSEGEEENDDGSEDDPQRQLVAQCDHWIGDELSDEDGDLLALNDRDCPMDMLVHDSWSEEDTARKDEPNEFVSVQHNEKQTSEGCAFSSQAVGACRDEDAAPRPPGSAVDHSQLEKSSNRTAVRGLISRTRGQQTWYQACLSIESLSVLAREVRDLSIALDRLVMLTTIRQRTRESAAETFGERLREGFARAEVIHGVVVADLGLRFKAEISKSLFTKGHLDTPVVHDLDVALATIERLAPYRSQAGMNQYKAMRCGLLEMETQWARLRACYLDILQESGFDRAKEGARLKMKEEARRPFREMQITLWNRRRMAAEEVSQRRFANTIKRWLRRDRRQMVIADRHSRRLRRHTRRKENISTSAQRLLGKLLHDWRRHISIGERKRRLAEERQAQKERADRWRAMNQPGLTMADILERRWVSGCFV